MQASGLGVGSSTNRGDVARIEFRTFFEECEASDKRVGTGRRDELGSYGIDASINFEADRGIGDHGADRPDLLSLFSDEGLTSEAWVNRITTTRSTLSST